VLLPALTFLAAALGPLSYLPGFRRMLRGRTSDGVSTTLCGVGVLSYGTWLGLAAGISGRLYALLVVSSCFAAAQAALAVRYTRGSPIRMLLWFLAAAGSGLLALRLPWVAVLYVAPLDLIWYGRAIRDVVRSVTAAAVSAWGWSLSAAANLAWVVEATLARNIPLVVQCALLTTASLIGIAATLQARRRCGIPGASSLPAPLTSR